MGGSIIKKLKEKLGKVSVIIIGALLLISILRGMIYFCGLRIFEIFPNLPVNWTIISLISAVLLTATTFSYANKEQKIWDLIGTISLRIIAILMVAFFLMVVERIFIPVFKIPGMIIIALIILVARNGFLRNRKIKKKQLTIKSPKLQQSKKIVFISDLHVDFIYGEWHTKKIVQLIKKENPDLVLIGGDLINTPKPNYAQNFKCFREISAPIYAVIGNHDVYFGPSTKVFEEVCAAGNITPLRNTSLIEKDLQIIGIDDKDLREKNTLEDILKQCNIHHTNHFSIFLTHRPIHLSKLAKYPIDLELAGHTHNGQVRGLHFIVRLIYQGYSYGKYLRKDKVAFISQGLGAGIPFRIGTEGEIVTINLKPE